MQEDSRGGPGYETRDANLRLAVWIGIGVLALILAAMFSMGGLLELLVSRDLEQQAEPVSLMGVRGGALPPEPRLEEDPVGTLRAMRREEEQLLGSYGWQDDHSDVVRIPIDRAMDLVLERGLIARAEVRQEAGR